MLGKAQSNEKIGKTNVKMLYYHYITVKYIPYDHFKVSMTIFPENPQSKLTIGGSHENFICYFSV